MSNVEEMVIAMLDPAAPSILHHFTIGAHNCGETVLRNRIEEAMTDYLSSSQSEGEMLSMSDFVLYLLGLTAEEHASEGR